jgi:hypothetical protein
VTSQFGQGALKYRHSFHDRESALADPFLIVFPLVAFLFPLALYCLALAYVNRSRRPVIVPGTWDFLGLLFALSGFLLFTMPVLINACIGGFIDYLPGAGNPGVAREWVAAIRMTYFGSMALGAILMLAIRRHKTAIFNVDTERFNYRLGQALAELGLDSIKRSGRLIIAPAERFRVSEAITTNPAALAGAELAKTFEGNAGGPRYAEVSVDAFPTFCHVTLHWESYSSDVRREIETHLTRALDSAVAVDNPVAGWLLTFSGVCMFLVTVASILVVVIVILGRAR